MNDVERVKNFSFYKFLLYFPILMLGFFVIGACSAHAEKNAIRINEVQITGGTGRANNDFVELYNEGSLPVVLDGWKLRKQTPSGIESSIRVFPSGSSIYPGEYFLWANTSDGFATSISANVSSSGTIAEGNTVFLKDEEDTTIDFISCTNFEGKNVIAYDEGKGAWMWIVIGTPGLKNIFEVTPSTPKAYTVRINELFPNPKEVSDAEGEFIELYNFGDNSVDLSGWKIADKSEEKELFGNITPKKYKALYKTVSLNNTDENISLIASDGEKIESVKYDDSQEGWSYALDEGVWKWTPIVTPDEKNRFPDGAMGKGVRLNEILPNPEGSEDGEFIELFNDSDRDEDVSWWTLQDGSGARYSFPEGTNIVKNGFLVVTKSEFGFSLNNSDETVDLLDGQGNVIDTMSYESSKEGVSLNFYGLKWRAGLSPTPGTPNNLNGEPGIQEEKVPKRAYKNMYAHFSVQARDVDGDEIKYRWDFGDGHKSYKRETKHKYKEEGEYSVKLRVDDGREPVEKIFILSVEEYPKRKLRITAFEPNPEGKDSEGEWVRIKNQDKKTVDLFGWSIATGKDKEHLSNHPIIENMKIKEGKEVTVTREMAKITLNNKKGVIELRSPDGKTVQTVKYKKEKGIEEGDVYLKEKGKEWTWKETKTQIESEDNLKEEVFEEPREDVWMDPVSDGEVGESSEEEVAVLWREKSLPALISPRVLGAQSTRLRMEGNRYVFTLARMSEHWTESLLRRVKGMARKMF